MKKIVQAWKNSQLSSKLVILVGFLVVAVVSALSTVAVIRERNNFRSELESQGRLLMDSFSLTIRDELYFLELDELADFAGVVVLNERVTFVRIFNRDGKILIDTTTEGLSFAPEADALGLELINSQPASTYFDWQTGQLVTGKSIVLGNQAVGALAIGLSTRPLIEKIAALTLQTTLIALVTLLVAFVLIYLLSRQVTTPLSELTGVAAEMAAGNLSRRIAGESTDEIGRLGRAFNDMAGAIEKRESDLRQSAARLEQTVEERTEELRKTVQELVRANAELEIAQKEAEEATRLKSEFLASMSHELRTPLNAVMGFSQLLLAGVSGPLTQDQLDKIERILANGQTLLDMINDLLDLSKIEAGRAELVLQAFSLPGWLEEIKRQLEGLAHNKGLAFEAVIEEGLPESIVSDPARLRQVATNLLANAIKFTEEGSVSIHLRPDGAEHWCVIVTDTGIGIPPHAQEYIFEEFRQVDGTSQRKYGGTGLGLSIVRKIALLMNGTVKVKSAVGEGSTFTVRLPLEPAQPEEADSDG